MSRRTTAIIGLGLISVLVTVGVLAIGAVATPLHLYRCVGYPLGNYKDDECKVPAPLGGPFKRIAFTESTAFSGAQTGSHVLSATITGVKVTITCKTAATSGAMENPEGGGAGILKETQIKFGECTLPEELQCVVPGKAISTVTLSGTTATGPAISLKPASGETLAEFKLEKCKAAGLNKSYTLKGTTVGAMNNEASRLEFTTSSGSSLTLSGSSATFTGSSELQSEESPIFVE